MPLTTLELLRKLIASISLFSFSFAIVGFHIAYYLQLQQVKMEMKRSIRAGGNHCDVVEFSFDQQQVASLEWEDDEEFEFQGEMYDVIEKSSRNGKLHIRCIADKKESELVAKYQEANGQSQSAAKWSMLKLATSFFTPATFDIGANPVIYITRFYGTLYAPLTGLPQPILAPPPKFG